MEKTKTENKLKPADCPQRHTHRALVGTGLPCATCAVVIDVQPKQVTEWASLGIMAIIEHPSTPIARAEGECLADHDHEMALRESDLREATRIVAVEIPKLHELTGWTPDREATQNNYDSAVEQRLYDTVVELQNSAERHGQKARAALLRRSELMAQRDMLYRRELMPTR